MSGHRTYDGWKCTPPPDEDDDFEEQARERGEQATAEHEQEQREHLWFSLPVRCWCGEEHVLGIDNRDEESSADDANAPGLDDRLNDDDGCPF